MTENLQRPFYAEYAWAFDLLIDRPVRKECAAITSWLVERGVRPGAEVLDAGCGTGRYSVALSRRGYRVHGIDTSPELLEQAAKQQGDAAPPSVTFACADIRGLGGELYDAILCRGVLNDIVDDEGREAVFAAFARALRPDGVLILDVREWESSAERKAREPLFRKRVETARGTLTFTSVTVLDPENRRLRVSEQHTLAGDGLERSISYEFVMRCWTRNELSQGLERHGFLERCYFGAYDAAVEAGCTDRLVMVARLSA